MSIGHLLNSSLHIVNNLIAVANPMIFCSRWSVKSPESLQQQTAAKKEKKIQNSVYKPPNIWTGKTVSLPKVLITSGQRWNCEFVRSLQCAGNNLVSEQASKAKAWHGGVEERRGKCKSIISSQKFLRKCDWSGHFEEKSNEYRCKWGSGDKSCRECI